jgi:CheY-like chemotaxis protein
MAEDKEIFFSLIKDQFVELGIQDHTKCTTNGKEALEIANEILDSCFNKFKDKVQGPAEVRVKPISFMLLDFNLPSMNGISIVKFVKDKVEDLNAKLEKASVVIIEPEYVF